MHSSRSMLKAAAVWRMLCQLSTTVSSLPVLLCYQPLKTFSMKSILNVWNPCNKGQLYWVYGALVSVPVPVSANLYGQHKRETKLLLWVDWCQGKRFEVPYISNSHSSGTTILLLEVAQPCTVNFYRVYGDLAGFPSVSLYTLHTTSRKCYNYCIYISYLHFFQLHLSFVINYMISLMLYLQAVSCEHIFITLNLPSEVPSASRS